MLKGTLKGTLQNEQTGQIKLTYDAMVSVESRDSMRFMLGSIDQPPSDAIDTATAPTTPIAPIDATWVVKAWLELGWQQCELADWQAALASFAQVLAVDPGSVLARQGQATALNGLGLYAEAILAAELALDRSPDRSPGSPDRSLTGPEACPIADSADLWGCYGKALLGMGRLEEALSAFGLSLIHISEPTRPY